jgi:hypothetical protein
MQGKVRISTLMQALKIHGHTVNCIRKMLDRDRQTVSMALYSFKKRPGRSKYRKCPGKSNPMGEPHSYTTWTVGDGHIVYVGRTLTPEYYSRPWDSKSQEERLNALTQAIQHFTKCTCRFKGRSKIYNSDRIEEL